MSASTETPTMDVIDHGPLVRRAWTLKSTLQVCTSNSLQPLARERQGRRPGAAPDRARRAGCERGARALDAHRRASLSSRKNSVRPSRATSTPSAVRGPGVQRLRARCTPWLRSQRSACGPFTPMRGKAAASASIDRQDRPRRPGSATAAQHAVQRVPGCGLCLDQQIVQPGCVREARRSLSAVPPPDRRRASARPAASTMRPPSTRMLKRVPSCASSGATNASPTCCPRLALKAMLVTRPAMSPLRMTRWHSLGASPGKPLSSAKPTSFCLRGLLLDDAQAALADEERLVHLAPPIPCAASSGVVRPSVSWPMMMCPFSSRSRRWASTPKGRMPSSAAGLHQRIPDVRGVLRGHVDLVAQLADEAHAQHARRHAGDARLRARRGTGRPRSDRSIAVSLASTSRDRGPARFIAAIGAGHVDEARTRMPHSVFSRVHLAIDGGRAGGRRGEVEALLRQPRDDAVVDDHARLVEHQRVARHADFQVRRSGRCRRARGTRPRRVRTDLHLAQRADVDEADARCARRAPPRARSSRLLLPVARVVLGPQPVAGLHEDGAGALRGAECSGVRRIGCEAAPGQMRHAAPGGRTAARWWCRPRSTGSLRSCARMRTAFMFECLPWLGPMPTVV